jgi:serine protease Do
MRKSWFGLAAIALIPALLLSAAVPARAEESVKKAYLGVAVGPADKDTGAVIHEINAKGPAEQAGLKVGDRIVKIGDKDLKDPEMLVKAVAEHKPGDKLMLSVMRDGKEQKMEVTLAEPPQARVRPKIELTRHAFLGVYAQPLNEELKKNLGVTVDKGAVVMELMPNSPAAKAGLAKDDVITALGDHAVTTPDELRAAVQKIGAGKEVTVKFMRGKEAKELKVKLGDMPFGFGRLHDFRPFDGKDLTLPPNFDREQVQKLFEEMRKQFRDFDEELEQSAK